MAGKKVESAIRAYNASPKKPAKKKPLKKALKREAVKSEAVVRTFGNERKWTRAHREYDKQTDKTDAVIARAKSPAMRKRMSDYAERIRTEHDKQMRKKYR